MSHRGGRGGPYRDDHRRGGGSRGQQGRGRGGGGGQKAPLSSLPIERFFTPESLQNPWEELENQKGLEHRYPSVVPQPQQQAVAHVPANVAPVQNPSSEDNLDLLILRKKIALLTHQLASAFDVEVQEIAESQSDEELERVICECILKYAQKD